MKCKGIASITSVGLIVFAVLVAFPSHTISASTFGFNYYAPVKYNNGYYGNGYLFDNNWPTAKPIVLRDIYNMASLGSGVVRIAFWPDSCGYTVSSGSGGHFSSNYNELVSNLPDLISMFRANGIKIIIVFSNVYLEPNRCGSQAMWQCAYGDSDQGFINFLLDSKTWIDGIVNSIERSPYKDAVLFYDYQNESQNAIKNNYWYVNFMYDWSAIPAGKRGVSTLWVPQDSDGLKMNLTGDGKSRSLDFVDFHSYQIQNFNPLPNAYYTLKNTFPNSTIVLGEFGRPERVCSNDSHRSCNSNSDCVSPGTCIVDPSGEANQKSDVLSIINSATTLGIPYYTHFTFWDDVTWSFGMGRNAPLATWLSPRDIYGAVSERLNLVQNSDMENLSGSQPAGWWAGGTVPFSFYAVGPSTSDAATGSYYARTQVNGQTSGTVWMCHNAVVVQGESRLYANFYFRTTMKSIGIDVHEYDFGGREIRVTSSPRTNSTGPWNWNNYLQNAGAWNLSLLTNTYSVITCIDGNVNASTNPNYLDIDAVSVYAR